MSSRRRLPRPVRHLFKRIKNDCLYGGFSAVLALFRALPLQAGLRLGAAIGIVAYYVLWPDRRRALEHLAIAFGDEKPEAERRRIARACFSHLGMCFVEFVNLERMRDRLDTYVALEDRAVIDACLARGKGLIWVTGHLGNWEILASYMGCHERYKVNAVSRAAYDRRMQERLVRLRAANGVRSIERGDARATRELIGVFRRNEVLAMLIDQDTKVQGVFVDFFGRPAWTPVAAAALAYKMDAPVIVGFIERLPEVSREARADKNLPEVSREARADKNLPEVSREARAEKNLHVLRHRITLSGPIDLPRTGDAQEDLRLATAEFTRRIEAQIRRVPEQWVWMHRRWKRQPAGVKEGDTPT